MNSPETKYLKNYGPPPFSVDHIYLTFEFESDALAVVTSIVKYRKNIDEADETTPLILDAEDLQIESVIANGMILVPGEYIYDGHQFRLNNTPEIFELEIVTRLEPQKNTSLEGLYQSGNVFCTQCEAEGFRKITPFPDRPDVMTKYTCTIVADKAKFPVLLSNGNLVKSGDFDDGLHYVRWEDPFKKPSYLFALVAGDLSVLEDTFITDSGRKIDLKIFSGKKNINHCGHAMRSLKQAMHWDEDRFGLEYDLDLYQIVAINDFNAGAMENKGLNVFNSKYVLAKPETATDDDFMNVQGVIGHEYFHNWTGNRVTLKNWFQLSLKEGLTVFRDQEFSSDLNSRGVKRISCIRNLRAFQFPEDQGPMTHPVRPESYIEMNNFYTMTVYEKGAEVVRMIHQLLGEEKFQKGMDLYFEHFDGKAVTTEDFVWVMEKASGVDLTQLKRWYSQSGTPTVTITRDYDEAAKCLKITFEQHTEPDRNQEIKLPMHIPVKIGLIDDKGNDSLEDDQGLIELKNETKTFSFQNVGKGCVPSFFREFSAPVKIKTDLSDDELAFLMAHDSDEFNKWDAAQTLFYNELKRFVSCIQSDEKPVLNNGLSNAFEKALIDNYLDKAFLAKMLTLPTETEIRDQFELVDVEAIHIARQSLEVQLAVKLEPIFYEMIKKCSTADPQSISHENIALRALKNLCLSFVGSLKTDESTGFVRKQFLDAENMTEELAAFRILSEIDPKTKKEAVDQFYGKWRNDGLVLDKWFSIQAASTLTDTLDKIRALLNHSQFSITNPNKVRALIYIFALFNPIHFHNKEGAGYTFIADKIIELDQINHQIAARLASSFNLFRKYDVQRQALMEKELERIVGSEGLSKNVYEIVSRALE